MSALPIEYPWSPVRRSGCGVVLQLPVRRARAGSGARPAPLRITRRGRLLITMLAAVAVAVPVAVAVAVAGLPGASAPFAGANRPAAPVTNVVVLPGETLWSIAEGVSAPGDDVRDVIAEVVELNGLETSTVRAGQELTVPLPD